MKYFGVDIPTDHLSKDDWLDLYKTLHAFAMRVKKRAEGKAMCSQGHVLPEEYWGKDCPICADLNKNKPLDFPPKETFSPR